MTPTVFKSRTSHIIFSIAWTMVILAGIYLFDRYLFKGNMAVSGLLWLPFGCLGVLVFLMPPENLKPFGLKVKIIAGACLSILAGLTYFIALGSSAWLSMIITVICMVFYLSIMFILR